VIIIKNFQKYKVRTIIPLPRAAEEREDAFWARTQYSTAS